jgi:hypothetical protein
MSAKRDRTLSPRPDPAAEPAGRDADAVAPSGTAAFSADGTGDPYARDGGAGPAHAQADRTTPGAVSAEDAVVRRTADGWRVGNDELPDLTCAMVLADLLAAELPTDIQQAVSAVPAARSPVAESAADEARRLRTTIGQLEHALMARIRAAEGGCAEPRPAGDRHRRRCRRQCLQPAAAASRGALPPAPAPRPWRPPRSPPGVAGPASQALIWSHRSRMACWTASGRSTVMVLCRAPSTRRCSPLLTE